MAGAVLIAASAAFAQRTTAPQAPRNGRYGNPAIIGMNYQDYFYGVITKITAHDLVLGKTKVGVPQTIQISKKTKYIRNGKRSSFSKLAVGEMVYVDLKTNKKTGVMTARKVVSGLDATVAP